MDFDVSWLFLPQDKRSEAEQAESEVASLETKLRFARERLQRAKDREAIAAGDSAPLIAKLRAELEQAQREEREALEDATRHSDVAEQAANLRAIEGVIAALDMRDPDTELLLTPSNVDEGEMHEAIEHTFTMMRIHRANVPKRAKLAAEARERAKAAGERAYAAKRELVKLGAWKEGE